MLPAIPYRVEIGSSQIFLYDESDRYSWPETCKVVWEINNSGGITETSERVRLKLCNPNSTWTLGPKKFNPQTRRWE